MCWLNQLVGEKDLLTLSHDEREFIVRRMECVLDSSPEVAELLTKEIGAVFSAMGKDIRPAAARG